MPREMLREMLRERERERVRALPFLSLSLVLSLSHPLLDLVLLLPFADAARERLFPCSVSLLFTDTSFRAPPSSGARELVPRVDDPNNGDKEREEKGGNVTWIEARRSRAKETRFLKKGEHGARSRILSPRVVGERGRLFKSSKAVLDEFQPIPIDPRHCLAESFPAIYPPYRFAV